MKKKIGILGAAQHSEVIIEMCKHSDEYCIAALFDDDSNLIGKKVHGVNVVGMINDFWGCLSKETIDGVLIGVSARQMTLRIRLLGELLKENVYMPNIIHPSAWISDIKSIGTGNIFGPNSVVSYKSIVGHSCVFYSNSVLEHHSVVKDNVYIGPGAKTAADVCVGSNSYLGANSTIIPHISIAENSIVAAGCVVTKDITKGSLVVGVPGVIKRGNSYEI
jgi:sugar O-acyltransferase (sialic acid O-acetyltransferase NeuD family)